MDGRHRETLEKIFAEAVPSIEFEAIEDLLILIGCRVLRESDERVTFERDGVIGSFDRAPPFGPTQHHVVLAVREFLTEVGVTP